MPPRPPKPSIEELAKIFGGTQIVLDSHAGRRSSASAAGDSLVSSYENLQATLLSDSGESLGSIIGTQISMVKADRKFQVGVAFSKKTRNAAQGEASDFKKKAR